ncbi:hypothetical protein B296_00023929 [Ensete ventricosum]|uniref:Uncharacterized protein n=1 Tax=Ensete ventricosum TaxID=4639 RepID=A0A427AJS4_ENSVE|nr:hypothetical protein B296_00023929 [Ensete ventricosum]
MKITEQLYQSLVSYSPPIWATVIGGVSIVVTLFLSMFLLFQHLSAYKNPEVARLLLFFCLICGEERTIDFLKRQGVTISNTPLLENASEKGVLFVMCVASVVHLYVFSAKPYKLMDVCFAGGVSVLGNYASLDCPLDPDEVRDCERPTKLRLPQPDVGTKSTTAIRESVRDVVLGGGEYIVNDLKFTVTHAVEPMEKGFTRFNEKLHKISENIRKHDKKLRTKDDSCIGSSPPSRRVVRGIDDPLLYGSNSDSGSKRGRKHRRKSGYTSAEGGDSSDPGHGRYEIHGRRWITKD